MKSIINLALVLTACGGSQSESSKAPEPTTVATIATPADDEAATSIAIRDLASLPSCTEKRENQLAFVKGEDAFFACASGDWVAVNIDGKDGSKGADGNNGHSLSVEDEVAGENCEVGGQRVQAFADADGDGIRDKGERVFGKPKFLCQAKDGLAGAAGSPGVDGAAGLDGATGSQGAQGDQGPQGAAGEAGSDGNDNHIADVYTCSGSAYSARFHASTPVALTGVYRAYVYTSGDVRAEAQITWPDGGGNPAGFSQPFSATYASGQAGNATAAVDGLINFVLGADSGTWAWSLNRTALTVGLVYSDSDFSPSTESFTLTCAKASF